VVAVLRNSVARPVGQATVSRAPNVLYFGSFENQINAIHQLHPAEFQIRTSTSVPEFTTLVRAGDHTHVVLDFRDGRLAAQLLLPIVASLNKPLDLIVVTTLDETQTYGLIPRNARILDGAIKEKQLLRLLGLSSVRLKSQAPKPSQHRTKWTGRQIATTLLALLITAILSVAMTLAVIQMTNASKKIEQAVAKLSVQPPSAASDGQVEVRFERAKTELMSARREVQQAQSAIMPELKKLNAQAVLVASQKNKAAAQVDFLKKAIKSAVNSRNNVEPFAVLRAKHLRGQITGEDLQQASITALTLDQRVSALDQRLFDAQEKLTTARRNLTQLRKSVAKLKSDALLEAQARLQNAEQTLEIYRAAMKQQQG
jgi:hypothetical protein